MAQITISIKITNFIRSVFVINVIIANNNSTIKNSNEIVYVVVFESTAVEPFEAIKGVISSYRSAQELKVYTLPAHALGDLALNSKP